MKRIIVSIFVLWAVATINFIIWKDDPAAFVHEWEFQYMDTTTKNMILRGTIESWPLRYVLYLRKMFTYGLVPPYFGWSRLEKDFIAVGMAERLPQTLFLIGTSLTSSTILGIIIGMFAASKQRAKKDVVITASSLFTWALPIFLVQFFAVFVFSYLLINYGIAIFPLNASVPTPRPTGLSLYASMVWHMALPIITLTIVGMGSWVIYTRNLIVDTLTQDYIVTARAKGLSERTVIGKHAFKSIVPPIATLITLAIPTIITGSIVTETIFGITGIGNYFCRAFIVEGKIVRVLDPPVIQSVFFIYATIAVALNLVADIIYGISDPRIRVGTRR